ncbi:hypothetical protein ACH5RR_006709 [Cinchona calisaya]|uniref:SBP-type domain-containing protein n=1 Tax=Cinchona calisaya TaxID=153742 RepID=A0ABD3APT8_9GENT
MDLQNSAIYRGKAIEVDKDVETSSPYSQGGDGFSIYGSMQKSSSKSFVSASLNNSGKILTDAAGEICSSPTENRKEENFIGIAKGEHFLAPSGSVYFGQPLVGQKLGIPKGSSNIGVPLSTSVSLPSTSSNTTKRSRVSHQSVQSSRCQVEGCNLDLTPAKDYHRRHRICESHSKSPEVIVAGVERRFCQQCSRFHNLSEFDDRKRSCRRRLSDHNARRRRPQQEAMHLSSMELSSSLYDRRLPNFLLNRMPSSSSNTSWESSCSSKMIQAGNSLIRTSGIDASAADSHLNEPQTLPRALSLLSTNSWGLIEPESTSPYQLLQATVSIAPAMQLEQQNWPLISSHDVSAEQEPPISPLESNGFKKF